MFDFLIFNTLSPGSDANSIYIESASAKGDPTENWLAHGIATYIFYA